MSSKHEIPASLARRLVALVYDALLLFAVLFFLSIPIVIPFDITYGEPAYILYLLYVHALAFIYLGWFWVGHRQTLGMRAWHLYLRPFEGDTLSWWLALRRYLAVLLFWIPGLILSRSTEHGTHVLFGLIPLIMDYAWVFTNSRRLTIHDVLSRTRLVVRHENRKAS